MGAGIGSIESGKRADLQMLDYRRFGLTPTLDPVQNLVYHAHSKDVELVMVDGNVLVEDFELKTADARALIDDAGAAANAAWERFTAKYDGGGARRGPCPAVESAGGGRCGIIISSWTARRFAGRIHRVSNQQEARSIRRNAIDHRPGLGHGRHARSVLLPAMLCSRPSPCPRRINP